MSICRSAVPAHISGRARRGIFAGRDKHFGNNVSFSQRKTRRAWKVNAHWHALYSETLNTSVRFHVTTHALRCIDKAGGLDNYILNASDYHIGTSGVTFRQRLLTYQENEKQRMMQGEENLMGMERVDQDKEKNVPV